MTVLQVSLEPRWLLQPDTKTPATVSFTMRRLTTNEESANAEHGKSKKEVV